MKIGIFITVRTGSTRLPQKAIRQVNGKPMLGYLISRMKAVSKGLADIFICTTDLEEDYVLDEIAAQYAVKCYHGDKDNIIKRHLDCANENDIEFIINIDGDDILCNPEYVKKVIDSCKNAGEHDVIKTNGLPFGTNSMAYKRTVLEAILKNYDFKKIETGWGGLILDEKMFKILSIDAKEEEKDDVRLTLDYEQDFLLFSNIIEHLFISDKYVSQDKIMQYIKSNPQIKQLNSNLNEEYWQNFNNSKKKERQL